MKKLLLIQSLFISFSFYCQTNELTLPIIKNGRWYLFTKSKEIELPKTYTYVNLFDKKGTAYFVEGNNYGVIDQNGKELIKSIYKDIQQFGNGIYRYSTPDGYEFKSIDSKFSIKCSWSNQLSKDWMIYKKDTCDYIINFNANEEIKLSKKSYLYHHAFNFIIIKNDTIDVELYDTNGVVLDKSDAFIEINQFYFYYKGEKEHFICDRNGKWDLPKKAKKVRFNVNEFQYRLDSTCYLVSGESKSLIIKADCDEIEKFDNYFKISKRNLVGLIDQNGKQIIPLIYSSISKNGKLYNVRKKNATGLLSENFKIIIPCEYSWFYSDSNYYYTFSEIGRGIISAKTYNEILKPVYDRFEIKESIIRAWANNRLFIFELNEDKSIKNRLIIENVVTINVRKPVFNPLNLDERLFELGWFYDTLSVFDKKGNWTGTANKWGIKNEFDSIIVKSKLNTPIYIDQASFSLVPSGKTQSYLLTILHADRKESSKLKFPFYKMIDYSTGKINKLYKIIQFDTLDYQYHSYARLIHETGYGFVFPDGQIIKADFIEPKDHEFIRYCRSQNPTLTNNSDLESVAISQFNNKSREVTNVYRYNSNYGFIHFNNAQWNFLDKNGDSLFEKPFDYVQNFYKNTSIVKRENGWGIITKDSLIVPTIYSSIERIPQFSDTVFKVQLIPSGFLYFDSSLSKLPFNDMVFQKGNEKTSIFSSTKGIQVIDNQNKIQKENLTSAILKEHGNIVAKNKKVFNVLNSMGNEICQSALKPLQFIDESHFKVGKNDKIGVLNIQLDTVIPIEYELIEKVGSNIIASKKSNKILYNEEYKLIKSTKKSNFLIDSTNQKWALLNLKSVVIYNKMNQKQLKWKTNKTFIHFFQNFLFSKDGFIYRMNGIQIVGIIQFSEVEFYKDQYCTLKDENNKWHLYDTNWIELTNKELKNRAIIYHGDHVFSMYNSKGFMVYDYLNNKEYNGLTSFKGDFNEQLIVAEKDGSYFYLNRQFQDIFNTKFKSATIFKNGYACISYGEGWTIIDRNGFQKSLTSFPELKQVGTRLFQTTKKPLYGFINSNGKSVIEPIFEKLTILENGLIQGIKEGEIRYFDYSGKVIY